MLIRVSFLSLYDANDKTQYLLLKKFIIAYPISSVLQVISEVHLYLVKITFNKLERDRRTTIQ
ncbi:hypothetical protein [Myxosarcina sp. GI1(2024)]